MIILGYDPGGIGANGVAVLYAGRAEAVRCATGTVDCVDSALKWFSEQLNDATPDGAGIDTYLSWSTGRAGWRPPDLWLRGRGEYASVKNSVFSSNSAAGSMAVQGMAMAIRLREKWPGIHLNETHPKLLHFELLGWKHPGKEWTDDAVARKSIAWLEKKTSAGPLGSINDHEWDALVSAWATYQGVTEKWGDLMDIGSKEGAGSAMFPVDGDDVTYYWPSSGIGGFRSR